MTAPTLFAPADWHILPGGRAAVARDDVRPCECGATTFAVYRSTEMADGEARVSYRVVCPACREGRRAYGREAELRAREVAVGTLDVKLGWLEVR